MNKKNDKAFQIFNSGLAFQIFNKPVRDGYLWDDKIFWKHVEYNGKKIISTCAEKGFYNLEDCMDDCIEYIKKYKSDNPVKTKKIDVISHDKN